MSYGLDLELKSILYYSHAPYPRRSWLVKRGKKNCHLRPICLSLTQNHHRTYNHQNEHEDFFFKCKSWKANDLLFTTYVMSERSLEFLDLLSILKPSNSFGWSYIWCWCCFMYYSTKFFRNIGILFKIVRNAFLK